jgi:hybrid cluster-associated redox disulfide protein
MLCVGCPISRFHTVANACAEYHLNEKDFLEELKQAIDVK